MWSTYQRIYQHKHGDYDDQLRILASKKIASGYSAPQLEEILARTMQTWLTLRIAQHNTSGHTWAALAHAVNNDPQALCAYLHLYLKFLLKILPAKLILHTSEKIHGYLGQFVTPDVAYTIHETLARISGSIKKAGGTARPDASFVVPDTPIAGVVHDSHAAHPDAIKAANTARYLARVAKGAPSTQGFKPCICGVDHWKAECPHRDKHRVWATLSASDLQRAIKAAH